MCWKVAMIQIAHYNFVRDTYSHQHNELSLSLIFKSKVVFIFIESQIVLFEPQSTIYMYWTWVAPVSNYSFSPPFSII